MKHFWTWVEIEKIDSFKRRPNIYLLCVKNRLGVSENDTVSRMSVPLDGTQIKRI